MAKHKIRPIVLILVVILLFLNFVSIAFASQKYCYAYPLEQYPGKEVAIHWSFEHPHETILEITDRDGNIVFDKVLDSVGNYKDNVTYWYGWKSNGTLASPGSYQITLTPNDEFYMYPSKTSVTLLEQPKEPAKLSINIKSPTTLTPNGNNYVQFTVTATIHNSGELPAENVRVNITLSSGLQLLIGGNNLLGSVSGGESRRVTWEISADTRIIKDRKEKVSATVTSNNTSNAFDYSNINVPGLVVIFLPGMGGTNLYDSQKNRVWFNFGHNDYNALELND